MTAAQPGNEWQVLVEAASVPYRRAGRFAWHFARGKLARDPVFRHLLEAGLIAPRARVLDLGCGQGLLASLLRSAGEFERNDRWPLAWGAAPAAAQVTGIELMPREIARARVALGEHATFIGGDMRTTQFPPADTVVMLDVLHYLEPAEQDDVLARARRALPAGGTLLLRVADASASQRFRLARWVDRLVTIARGRGRVPQFGRPLAAWAAQLESLGLEVQSEPMSRGTPFANVLLVGRVASAAAPSLVPPAVARIAA
jgi:SAM-dependent methyltransferase